MWRENREKTLRASLASSYNASAGSAATSPVVNSRLGLSYAPKGGGKEAAKHNCSLGVNVLNRLGGTPLGGSPQQSTSQQSTPPQAAFTELTATMNYTYSF